MTTYTAIPDTDIDSESPVTVDLMTKMRDNPIAITEGATGAPKVQTAGIADLAVTAAKIANNTITATQIAANAITNSELNGDAVAAVHIQAGAVGASEIAANAVHQSELYTTTDNVSGNVSSESYVNLSPTGGLYAFNCFAGSNNSTVSCPYIDVSDTSPEQVRFYNASASFTYTAYLRSRYVPASPPYDLGDGPIPLFINVGIANGSGEITRTQIAEDPPWAYHGPTSIVPTRKTKDGRQFITRRVPHVRFGTAKTLKELTLLFGRAPTEKETLDFLMWNSDPDPEIEEVEIDQSIKNADKDIVPHLFGGNDLTGETIAMLSADDALMIRLRELAQNGENLSALLHDGYLIATNNPLNRRTAAGVNCYEIKFKNVGGV